MGMMRRDNGDGSDMAAVLLGESVVGQPTSRLVERFAATGDERAFAALVARHGPMVLATCRRLLANPADADDAFQATFLVLARRAASVGDSERLAPWLHGVAARVASRCRRGADRRRRIEAIPARRGDDPPLAPPPDEGFELRAVLDEELARLPSKFRDPLILCYLDGLTSDEAARQLSWPVGTVRSRLAGARDRLRSRLARRGYAPNAVLAVLSPATLPTAAVSPFLQAATVRLALGASVLAVGLIPPTATAALLARGVLASMLITKIQTALLLAATTATLAVGSATLIAAQDPGPAVGAAASAPLRPSADTKPITGSGPSTATKTNRTDQTDQNRLKALRAVVSREQETFLGAELEANARLLLIRQSEMEIAALQRKIARDSKEEAVIGVETLTDPIADTFAAYRRFNPNFVGDEQYARDYQALQKEVDLRHDQLASRIGLPMMPKPAPAQAPAPTQPRAAQTTDQPVAVPPAVAPAEQPKSPLMVQTIQGTPFVMVVSGEQDRVTMIDPTTEKRAVLKLVQPLQTISPYLLYKPEDRNHPALVGLTMGGRAITQLPLFDCEAFQWRTQVLAEPVGRVQPVAQYGFRWITFDLFGFRITEAPAYNPATREWRPNKLDQPPQMASQTRIGEDGLRITASGEFYHFQQVDGTKVITLEIKNSAMISANALIKETEFTGIFANKDGSLWIRDGDTLNIIDPKTLTLRRINLVDDKDAK